MARAFEKSSTMKQSVPIQFQDMNSKDYIYLSLDQSLIAYLTRQLKKIQTKNQDIYLKTIVILPTRRAVKELKKSLLNASHKKVELLPRLMAVNDVQHFSSLHTQEVLCETKRKGLILKVLESFNEPSSPEVANLLMALLDDIYTHEADVEKLMDIVPEIYAEHWQLTSQYLKDFWEKWQGVLKKEGAIEKTAYNINIIKELVKEWVGSPPQDPIFLAGLDGFMPCVQDLIHCVQNLPQGHVVFNGYLPNIEKEIIHSTHPNFLLDSFVNKNIPIQFRNVDLETKAELPERTLVREDNDDLQFSKTIILKEDGYREKVTGTSRAQLISHMMSDQGYEERDLSSLSLKGIPILFRNVDLETKAELPERTLVREDNDVLQLSKTHSLKEDGYIHVLESETLNQEAQNIALLIRKNLEDPTHITAIITPDQNLAEKIKYALERWNIRIDLAGGTPLSKAPLGRFILDSLSLSAPFQDATSFLSLLKSPFATLGYDKSYELKNHVRRFECFALRASVGEQPILDEGLQDLMGCFDKATAEFFTLKMGKTQPLSIWLRGHIQLLEALNPCLWESDNGKIAANCLMDLLKNADYYPDLSLADYRQILQQTLSQETLRESVNHPRVKLMSPIQGAYTSYDQVILCGLNEGIWPQRTKSNPWLNRDMSLALGLPDPQILIGRAASLLAQNMTCPEVIMSFSKRRGTEPAFPSRWILRLQALAKKIKQEDDLKIEIPLKTWAFLLDAPTQKINLESPQPTPPLAKRPKRFSISDIERFFRDPYQMHAKHVLKLNPLDDLNTPFGPADFGIWIHKILEQFVLQDCPLETLAKTYLPSLIPKETSYLWFKSFQEIKPWILNYLLEQKGNSLETLVEKKFTCSFDIQGTQYELVGKADRIDRLMDGTYEIIDYKTGKPPSKKDIECGDAPQLPLLAHLFEKNNSHVHVSKLTYVGIGEQKIKTFMRNALVDDTVQRLVDTLEYYNNPHNAYAVNPYEALQDRFNPYAHLERTTEWLEHGSGKT